MKLPLNMFVGQVPNQGVQQEKPGQPVEQGMEMPNRPEVVGETVGSTVQQPEGDQGP